MDNSVERLPLDQEAWFQDVESKAFDVEYVLDEATEAMTVEERINMFREFSRAILGAHKAEDMVPASGKVVVFDLDLPVKHAFFGLLEHDIKCAPVWDSMKLEFVGMLTVSDFLDILRYFYKLDKCKSVSTMLGDQCIRDWSNIKGALNTSIPYLLSVSPNDSLLHCISVINRYHIHRIPVMQTVPEKYILCLLTHQRLLNFLLFKFKYAGKLSLLHRITIEELNAGLLHTHVETASFDSPLVNILDKMAEEHFSAIPIVDENGALLDVYSRSDILYLAIDKTYHNLDMTVKQALSNHSKSRAVPFCYPTDSIFTAICRLVQTRRLRVIIVEPGTKKVIGTLSVSNIFNFLIDKSDVAFSSTTESEVKLS